MMQTEYKVVRVSGDFTTLENRVNHLISEGWMPVGGASMSYNISGNPVYIQAMILEKK